MKLNTVIFSNVILKRAPVSCKDEKFLLMSGISGKVNFVY